MALFRSKIPSEVVARDLAQKFEGFNNDIVGIWADAGDAPDVPELTVTDPELIAFVMSQAMLAFEMSKLTQQEQAMLFPKMGAHYAARLGIGSAEFQKLAQLNVERHAEYMAAGDDPAHEANPLAHIVLRFVGRFPVADSEKKMLVVVLTRMLAGYSQALVEGLNSIHSDFKLT